MFAGLFRAIVVATVVDAGDAPAGTTPDLRMAYETASADFPAR